VADPTERKNTWLNIGMVVGGGLLFVALVCLIVYFVGFYSSSNALERINDPGAVAKGVSWMLIGQAVGILSGLVGSALFLTCFLVRIRRG